MQGSETRVVPQHTLCALVCREAPATMSRRQTPVLCPWLAGEIAKLMIPKIFVAIASYADPELPRTLEDCSAMARWPERLRFGICWQQDPAVRSCCAFMLIIGLAAGRVSSIST